MAMKFGHFAMALAGAASFAGSAMAQGTVPAVIKARVNELVATCANAGGTLGDMRGQGQFVIPADLTGDGRTDFIVSEGNFPCAGKPSLFRPDGLGRLQVYAGDGAGGARLLFDDRLIAYRVLAGKPSKLQIARRGAACGPGAAANARCGDELRWNAAASRFDAVATDGRPATARAVTAPQAAATAVPAAAATPAGGKPAPAGAIPPVLADAATRFKANCRKIYLADKPQNTDWIDGACADEWKRVADAQPALEQLLLAVPGGPGATPGVAELKQRMARVQWKAPGGQGDLATGVLGGHGIGITGKARPEAVNVNWSKVGAEIPLDIPAALMARGATLTLTRCEKMGTGEGERTWSVSLPGRPPFALDVFQRTAPTGGAWSFYNASLRVDGAPAARGPTNCERFW